MVAQPFREKYYQLLKSHVTKPQESQLAVAAELGRRLVLADVQAEEIGELHEQAIRRLGQALPDIKLLGTARLISAPLIELLMTYGLAFREQAEKQKRVEEALLESERFLQTIIDNEPECVKLLAPDGSLLQMNRAGLDMIEADLFEQVRGRKMSDLIAEDFRMAFDALSQKVFSGQSGQLEFEVIGLKGTHRWLSTHAVPLCNQDDEIIALLGITRDITEHKRAVEKLKESEEQFRMLTQTATDAIVGIGGKGEINIWNDAATRIFGYKANEAIGHDLHGLIVPRQYREKAYKGIERFALNGKGTVVGRTTELTALRKDGTEFPVELSISCRKRGERWYATGIIRDISERKRAEQSLRESKENLSLIYDTVADVIFQLSVEPNNGFRFTSVNHAFLNVTGLTEEQIIGKMIEEVIPESAHDLVLGKYNEAISTNKAVSWEETSVYPNGKLTGIVTVCPFVNENNVCTHLIGSVHDITERKQAEEALRESEEKFRALFEESKDAVFFSTPEGKFLDINPAGVELFGYTSKQELLQVDIGRDIYAIPHDRDEFQKILDEQGFVKDYEVVLKKKNGAKITVLETATVVRNENGRMTAIRGIMRDVTERKKLEGQLLQAQKMETIGTLAGGVAHDFNNLLTGILGNASLGLQNIEPDNPAYEYLVEIEKAGERASDLTNQLLSFSRRQTLRKKHLDLNHAIDDLLKMLRRILGEDIQLNVEFSSKTATVFADAGQVQQVLMNLFTNARDAMPHGGTLTLKTGIVPKEQLESRVPVPGEPENYALIVVSDTGSGIDKESLPRIFDPFYTTKEVGKGTGLGLAVVHGIIEQHGGRIAVESETGKGTTFRIFLPVVEKTESVVEIEKQQQAIPGSGETVLVVEDDRDVRNVTSRILTALGYKVFVAQDAEEAMNLFEKEKDRIDLIVTDVVMPKQSGPEMYSQMNSIKPKLPVLFVTGYDFEQDVEQLDNLHTQACRSVLQKPYTKDILSQKIRQVLEGQ